MDFYSDNEPSAAAWLRELIQDKQIPQGEVDATDIRELRAERLRDFRRVHLFAGIGGWAYALELAGWPRGRSVWTGSCPCQPFSAAGKLQGEKDSRHLWPMFFRLIRECEPPTIFGEQVSGRAGREWLARVRDDLETIGYAVGCADLPACCAGAPHIRQRLFWVANAANDRASTSKQTRQSQAERRSHSRRLAIAGLSSSRRHAKPGVDPSASRSVETIGAGQTSIEPSGSSAASGMEHAESDGRRQGRAKSVRRSAAGGCGEVQFTTEENEQERQRLESIGLTWEQVSGDVRFDGTDEFGFSHIDGLANSKRNGRRIDQSRARPERRASPWGTATPIVLCDGKARRIEPSIFPLAHGIPGRVGLLRGSGNAIVPEVAATFVRAFLDAERSLT